MEPVNSPWDAMAQTQPREGSANVGSLVLTVLCTRRMQEEAEFDFERDLDPACTYQACHQITR